jgi:exopolyphosphatase / guanosine-5'-triphosphate,3'-diphosphate pyrophosphatase
MLLAAIDIGSNAVRLFFANVFDQNGEIVVEKASLVRVPIRLGEEVFKKGKISKEKAERLVKTMNAFKLLIEVVQPVAFRACATAAMREAENSEEVLKRIKKEAGIDIQVIDGLEEARILSTVSNLSFNGNYKRVMFIDVGGGSTEISILENQQIVESNSFKIGTVRLLNGMVKASEWGNMQNWLTQFKGKNGQLLLVGSGGNINKITKLYGDIGHKTLSFSEIEQALNHLGAYSVQDRIELMGLRPDRADVIIPAGQIFHFIMKYLQAGFVFVPKIGLSDGMVSILFREQTDQTARSKKSRTS